MTMSEDTGAMWAVLLMLPARPAGSGSGPAPRRPRPALLLVAPYAFALGFFWPVAG
jgi:hypothetical protein